MRRLLSCAVLIGLVFAGDPPTRDPHSPGYVAAKELPDGANAPADADGNFILGPTHHPAPEMTCRRRAARYGHQFHHGFRRQQDSIPESLGMRARLARRTRRIRPSSSSPPAIPRRTRGAWRCMSRSNMSPGTAAPFIVGADGPDPLLFKALDSLIAEHACRP